MSSRNRRISPQPSHSLHHTALNRLHASRFLTAPASTPTRAPRTGAKVRSAVIAPGAGLIGREAAEQHLTECSPVGERLVELGIDRLSFVSIDVEGAELSVVQSLVDASPRLSLGVVLVEVRADGQRTAIMTALLDAGLRYVGSLRARGSEANDVVDDCFVNATHLRIHFPDSRAAKALRRR